MKTLTPFTFPCHTNLDDRRKTRLPSGVPGVCFRDRWCGERVWAPGHLLPPCRRSPWSGLWFLWSLEILTFCKMCRSHFLFVLLSIYFEDFGENCARIVSIRRCPISKHKRHTQRARKYTNLFFFEHWVQFRWTWIIKAHSAPHRPNTGAPNTGDQI